MNEPIIIPEYPPTVNLIWRKTRTGRIYMSSKGRDYRNLVAETVALMRCQGSFQKEPFQGNLKVVVLLYPPDHRRRDIDNGNKALLDALTKAGVWIDDSQIKQLFLAMSDETLNQVVVHIEELGAVQQKENNRNGK